MALDAGAIPEALPAGVARADFNTMRGIINGSFPLQSVDIGALQIIAALLGPQAVETAKIKLLNITAALLATNAVETAKIKNLNVTIGKAELGFGRYVERLIDVADWNTADFTKDGAWHVNGLDASGIVPAGAKSVIFEMVIRATAASSSGKVRRDDAHDFNRINQITQVANQITQPVQAIVACDTDRLFDYFFNNTVDIITLAIVGWFI